MEVNMLVGSDQYWELMTGRGPDGPVAVSTELGWVLSGPAVSNSCAQSFLNLTMITHTLRVDGLTREVEELLDELPRSFWDLESFGIVDAKVPSVLEKPHNL